MSLEQRQTLHCLRRLFDCCRCRAAVRAAGVTAAASCAVTACVRAWPFVVAAVASLTVLPLLLLMLPVCWVVQDPANEPVWPALYCHRRLFACCRCCGADRDASVTAAAALHAIAAASCGVAA
jgi:hypothetical protein